MAVLLKTASVRVSSIQIMQVRVQNRGVFGKVDTMETYQKFGRVCMNLRPCSRSRASTLRRWSGMTDFVSDNIVKCVTIDVMDRTWRKNDAFIP